MAPPTRKISASGPKPVPSCSEGLVPIRRGGRWSTSQHSSACRGFGGSLDQGSTTSEPRDADDPSQVKSIANPDVDLTGLVPMEAPERQAVVELDPLIGHV